MKITVNDIIDELVSMPSSIADDMFPYRHYGFKALHRLDVLSAINITIGMLAGVMIIGLMGGWENNQTTFLQMMTYQIIPCIVAALSIFIGIKLTGIRDDVIELALDNGVLELDDLTDVDYRRHETDHFASYRHPNSRTMDWM